MEGETIRQPGIGDSTGGLLRHPSPAIFALHKLSHPECLALPCAVAGAVDAENRFFSDAAQGQSVFFTS